MAFSKDFLKNKTIVVTGGGSGLGLSMTTFFLEHGAKVFICGRTLEKLKASADALKDKGLSEIYYGVCDVRDPDAVSKMFDQAFADMGSVNVLLNNAAGNFISPTERLSANAFKTVVDIVLLGTANCTLEIGKRWIEKEEAGCILNITTTYATTGSAYVVPSATAKAGVLNLTRSLAVEWGGKNIRSVAIAPGPFPTTGAWDRLFPGKLAEIVDPTKRIPLGRVGKHEELCNLAGFMVSDLASYINGEVITIDGGEWLKGAGQMNVLGELSENDWDNIAAMIRKAK